MATTINELMEAIAGIKGGVDAALEEIKAATDDRLEKLEAASKQRLIEAKEKIGTSEDPYAHLRESGKEFRFGRAIHGIKTKNWKGCEYERDVFAAFSEKTMTTDVDSAGGYIVPIEFVPEIIELLRSQTVVIKMGAQELNDLVGAPVLIPKQTGATTAEWIGEGSSSSESDLALGQIALKPRQVVARSRVSNQLLRRSTPSIESMLRRDMTLQLARAIDLAALRGSGSVNQPLGIANTPGINTVAIGTNGGGITYAKMVDMETEVDVDDALMGTLGFVMNPRLKGQIGKLVDGESLPLFRRDPANTLASTLLGYVFATSSQIPTNLSKGSGSNLTELYFGNWADVLIGNWGSMQFAATDVSDTDFQNNTTSMRVIMEVDVALRHEQSMCLINDAASGL